MNRRRSAWRQITEHRRGTAQIELTLFLPTCAALMMVLFTIFSFSRTRAEVAIQSRHEAWMKRNPAAVSSQTLDAATDSATHIGRILHGQLHPAAGLVTAGRTADANVYLRALSLLTAISSRHAVFAGSWDYRTIPFDDQQRHPALQLDRRVSVFGSIQHGIFAELASVQSGFTGDAAGLNSSLHDRRSQAQRQIQQAVRAVTQMMSSTRRELDQRMADLRRLETEVPVDETAVDQMKQRIRHLNSQLSKLQQQLGQLHAAQQLTGI